MRLCAPRLNNGTVWSIIWPHSFSDWSRILLFPQPHPNLMSDNPTIQDTHLRRRAYVYIRQSSASQVLVNRESTQRQYQLSERAVQLGWSKLQIKIMDEDLAQSGSGVVTRNGFTQMTHEVAMGQVGIILCLEASRIARNNAEWYRLLELCGVTDTLIGDLDGLYHPGLFKDRLLLGLKGAMAEAELHVLRLRLNGALGNKAKRGELRRGLPVGLLWGEAEGQVIFHPDQSLTGAIRTVFEKFAELGSARQVWLWFKAEGLLFTHQCPNGQILWVKPTYVALHSVLSNPVYVGAYAYGKSRCERSVDETGRVRKRARLLPMDQWPVLIRDHHPGFIDWATFEMNQTRLATNCRPGPEQAAGLAREGSALLQGLATCGRCGRHLRVYHQGKNSTPGDYCANSQAFNGRGVWCSLAHSHGRAFPRSTARSTQWPRAASCRGFRRRLPWQGRLKRRNAHANQRAKQTFNPCETRPQRLAGGGCRELVTNASQGGILAGSK